MNNKKIKIFCSYSHKDEEIKDELEKHLSIYKRIGLIELWTDRKILPGENWSLRINDEIENSDVVLFLVSADFISSDYCFEVEVKKAIKQHEMGQSVVVPIILRECNWEGAPFEYIQGLPTDMKPIVSKHWFSKDEGYNNVSLNLGKIIKVFLQKKKQGEIDEFNALPDSIESYINFIEKYKNGEYVNQVKSRLIEMDEENAWKLANSESTLHSYKSYLIKYPIGSYSDLAKKAIAEIDIKKEIDAQNINKYIESVVEKLDSEKVKGQIINHLAYLINLMNTQEEKNQINLSLVFVGNPGTGKTSAARMYGEILKKIGLLKNGHVVEVSRHDLIAGFVGQTSLKVNTVVESAIGGVLFIDEVYTISIGSQDSFGQEALNTLMYLMEKYKGAICFIFAGYPKEINDFFELNVGLKRRISNTIKFDNLEPEILIKVFKAKLDKQGFNYTQEYIDMVKQIIIKESKMGKPYFGNYIFVENLLQNSVMNFIVKKKTKDLNLSEKKLDIDDIPIEFETK